MEAVRLCCGVAYGETEGERVMTSVVITVLVILDVVVFRIIGINMLRQGKLGISDGEVWWPTKQRENIIPQNYILRTIP